MCVGVVLHVYEPEAYLALLSPPKKVGSARTCALSPPPSQLTSCPVILVHPLQSPSSSSSSSVCFRDAGSDKQLGGAAANLPAAARHVWIIHVLNAPLFLQGLG